MDVKTLNMRADVIHPLLGPPIAAIRAAFTIEDAYACASSGATWASPHALYLVFSPPKDANAKYQKNKTYEFTEKDLKVRKADKFEVVVES